jgi:hypothetical protein
MTTTNQHPITPPSELLKQWEDDWLEEREHADVLLIQAFQAGADRELEACCEWFQEFYRTESWVTHDLKHFRAARRPKPPSLKEQALAELGKVDMLWDTTEFGQETLGSLNTIRRALEALDD